MRLNRNILLGALGGVFVLAAVGMGIVYAQQTSTFAQPVETPELTKKPARQVTKPVPKPHQQQEAQQHPSNAAPQAAPQPQTISQLPASVFEEHIRQAKITTCANIFGALGHKVADNSIFTAQTQWDPKASDAHAIQSIVALGDAANPTQHAAGVVFAAPTGQSCEGTLVRVTPTNNNCQDLGIELTKQNGRSSPLGDLSMITLPNGAQIVLVPFGNACIAVTTLRAAG